MRRVEGMRKASVLGVAAVLLVWAGVSRVEAQAEYRFVRIVGGTPEGSWGITGSKLAELINRSVKGVTASNSPGATVANVVTVNEARAQLGISSADAVHEVYYGLDKWKGKEAKNVRFLAALHTVPAHAFVRADSPIQEFREIATKPLRIQGYTKGSITHRLVEHSLSIFGSSMEDLQKRAGVIQYVSDGPAVEMMRNSQLDLIFRNTGAPSSWVLEAETSMSLRFLKMDNAYLKAITARIPGLVVESIPAGTYKAMKDDYKTFSVVTVLIVPAGMPDAVAEGITASLWDNLEEFKKIGGFAKTIKFDEALRGNTIPVHPGAARYYRSKGVKVEN
ncbi:MAG: TAXI family TRAP transporter solute-binding subunit [Candidatus Rokubacteria bacterium]|nr:TAXI family TRAP transporter solute-binding subunit [Candidatus Rokubacteria bacterium]